MTSLRLTPMTAVEYAAFVSRLVTEYAADHVRAGTWSAGESEGRARAEVEALLPDGRDSPGVLLLTARTDDGEVVGRVWVGPRGSTGGAWIYDIEVDEPHRGRGHGRRLLAATETEVLRAGATSLGLNVFGDNTAARALYESAGYTPTTLQLRKPLGPQPPDGE